MSQSAFATNVNFNKYSSISAQHSSTYMFENIQEIDFYYKYNISKLWNSIQ